MAKIDGSLIFVVEALANNSSAPNPTFDQLEGLKKPWK